MPERTCSIEDCTKKAKTRGWCGMHYRRWRLYGDPLFVQRVYRDTEARFWSQVEESSIGCWLWTGASRNGYGRMKVGGRLVSTHRWAYEQLIGEIPEGLTLDHLCRTPACVHPWHMDPTPTGVNTLRGEGPTAANARKTRCKRGHPFDVENTYVYPTGERACRACRRMSYHERKSLSSAALSGSEACERAVKKVLARYGRDVKTGAPSVIVITQEESRALERVPYAHDAYLLAFGDYSSLVGPWGQDLAVLDALARVTPQVRQACRG